jgi:hypothetical protein
LAPTHPYPLDYPAISILHHLTSITEITRTCRQKLCLFLLSIRWTYCWLISKDICTTHTQTHIQCMYMAYIDNIQCSPVTRMSRNQLMPNLHTSM